MLSNRKQAHLLSDWLTRERPHLRAVLIGGRREGKSDLLAQTRRLLFDSAEGPLPFWFRFEPAPIGEKAASTHAALLFASSFCQQMRAFLLRQEEILWSPPSELAEEVQRPGLPLSLIELAQELIGAIEKHEGPTIVQMASRLPGRFASREGRPVCLLWDDCHNLELQSPFLNELEGRTTILEGSICFLLTGMAPTMRELAGRNSWTALQLSPLSTSEALILAESLCKESGIRFNRAAWEIWFAVSGTSPGWFTPIIESAAIRGESLESVEQVGHQYAEEVDHGSIGTFLANRWPLLASDDLPANSNAKDIAAGLVRRDSNFLTSLGVHSTSKNNSAEDSKPARIFSLLEQNEWVRRHAFTLESSVSQVETDWLQLEANRAVMGSARAKARLVQSFLLRAHRKQLIFAATAGSSRMSMDAIEQRLISPVNADAFVNTASGDALVLPKIHSVVRETMPEGELFWAFGEIALPKRIKKSDSRVGPTHGGVPSMLLLVLSEVNPTTAMISEWARRVQQEIISPADYQTTLNTDIWVVIPDGGSLAPTGAEKRLTGTMLGELLTHATAPADSPIQQPPADASSSAERSRTEIGKRLADLHARAQLLQTDLRAVETPKVVPDSSSERQDRRNEFLRQALSLSLMLASADLAATGSGTRPAADGAQVELVELQLRCQRLLDEIRAAADNGEPFLASGKISKKLPPAL